MISAVLTFTPTLGVSDLGIDSVFTTLWAPLSRSNS